MNFKSMINRFDYRNSSNCTVPYWELFSISGITFFFGVSTS